MERSRWDRLWDELELGANLEREQEQEYQRQDLRTGAVAEVGLGDRLRAAAAEGNVVQLQLAGEPLAIAGTIAQVGVDWCTVREIPPTGVLEQSQTAAQRIVRMAAICAATGFGTKVVPASSSRVSDRQSLRVALRSAMSQAQQHSVHLLSGRVWVGQLHDICADHLLLHASADRWPDADIVRNSSGLTWAVTYAQIGSVRYVPDPEYG